MAAKKKRKVGRPPLRNMKPVHFKLDRKLYDYATKHGGLSLFLRHAAYKLMVEMESGCGRQLP